jgi:transposase
MMGTQARLFTPIAAGSLDDLVPADHFYRQLGRILDLAFVRELVQATYAEMGRPSIDPVVFFKLQRVMFFEGIRSERQLVRLAADRLSVRWYLGYNLDEVLPDHSSLTRIRARYGVAVFRRFFEAIVAQCQQAGLVWGRELYFDATQTPPKCRPTLPWIRSPRALQWKPAQPSRQWTPISRRCSQRVRRWRASWLPQALPPSC